MQKNWYIRPSWKARQSFVHCIILTKKYPYTILLLRPWQIWIKCKVLNNGIESSINSDRRDVEFLHFQIFSHTLRPCRSFRHLFNFAFYKKTFLKAFRRKNVKNDSFCCRTTIIVLYLKVKLTRRKYCLTNNELP